MSCTSCFEDDRSKATQGRWVLQEGCAKAQLNDLEHPGVPIHQEVLGNQGLTAMASHGPSTSASCFSLCRTLRLAPSNHPPRSCRPSSVDLSPQLVAHDF